MTSQRSCASSDIHQGIDHPSHSVVATVCVILRTATTGVGSFAASSPDMYVRQGSVVLDIFSSIVSRNEEAICGLPIHHN